MKKLLVLIFCLFGCDSSSVLANIDTYTCAYLPGVIDCSTPEVHDKAVSILQNGAVEAQMSCYFEVPYQKQDFEYLTDHQYYTILEAYYEVTAFHDGSVLTSCQVGGPVDFYQPFSASNMFQITGTRFIARSSSANSRRYCFAETYAMNQTPFMFEVEEGVVHIQKGELYYDNLPPHQYEPVLGNCAGINLEYFE